MELDYLFGIDSVFPDSDSEDLNNTSLSSESLYPTFEIDSTTASLVGNGSGNSTNETTPLEWWEVFDRQYFLHGIPTTCVIAVSYFIILILGLVGNSLVILVYIYRPKMRTVTNLFLMNLAVADSLVVSFCFVGNFFTNIYEPWGLGWFMCKAVSYIQGISVCASAWLLAAIAVDRCKAVYKPLGQPGGLSRTQATCAVVGIWIIALCLPLPWTQTLRLDYEGRLPFCIDHWENANYSKWFFLGINTFAFYGLPSIVIITTNIMIWYHLRKRQVPQAAASTIAIRHMHRTSKHSARKMLGIVTVTFLVSWLPLYVFGIRYKYFDTGETESEILLKLLPIAQFFGSCNSSINPLLYTFLNKKFRAAFHSLMPSCQKILHRKVPSSVVTRTNNTGTMVVGLHHNAKSV